MEVLFVCSGNTCRSPMAAGLARVALDGLGVEVRSAGLLFEGEPATDHAIEVMGRRGIDISSHRSALLPGSLEPAPDLIVGMSLEHVRSVVELDQGLFPRSFMLKELVRLAEARGPRRPGESVEDYLASIGQDRKISALAGVHSPDDIDDPIGKGLRRYEKTAKELEELIAGLARHLWPGR